MTDFSQLQSALAERLQGRDSERPRPARQRTCIFRSLAGMHPIWPRSLRPDFGAELMLMVANDRRADKGAFEIHYLFANDRENWFAHATAESPV